jgi:predicted Zn-dependent protease
VRRGNHDAALVALKKAAALEVTPGYYHYVLAVALNDQGQAKEALETLTYTQGQAPGQPNVLAALAQYSLLAGDQAAATRYQAELNAMLKAAGWQ